jgi:hypothetical protein
MSVPRNNIGNQGYRRAPRAIVPAIMAASALLLSGCGGSSPNAGGHEGDTPSNLVTARRVQFVAQQYQNMIARIRATTPQTHDMLSEDCPPPPSNTRGPHFIEPYKTITTTIASADDSGEYQLVVDELPGANGRPDPAKLVAINLLKIDFKGCRANQPFQEISIDTDETSQTDPTSIGWSLSAEHSTNGTYFHYDGSYATSTGQGAPLLTVRGFNFITDHADAILSGAAHRAPVHSVQP